MDAEQRSVFQGIVYYYRENMVNCRYQVTLKDAVDGALLQQALDAARAKAPYYFQKPVWEKKLLHLEPSDAPCPVYSYLRSSLPVPVRGRGSALNSTALILL